MAAIAGVTTSLTTSRVFSTNRDTLSSSKLPSRLNHPVWKKLFHVKPLAASGPDAISEKVVESIKEAEEACAGDPVSGECVAAWDTVEELSAAASHARDKNKNSDPLETYCKDNPETDECRTYDN
ncbi:unnamed protein product [Rhodiola kirilowii]